MEIGNFRLLAANSDFIAPLALCRLFTLVTKHRLPPDKIPFKVNLL
jgi:hypothetical protein